MSVFLLTNIYWLFIVVNCRCQRTVKWILLSYLLFPFNIVVVVVVVAVAVFMCVCVCVGNCIIINNIAYAKNCLYFTFAQIAMNEVKSFVHSDLCTISRNTVIIIITIIIIIIIIVVIVIAINIINNMLLSPLLLFVFFFIYLFVIMRRQSKKKKNIQKCYLKYACVILDVIVNPTVSLHLNH